MRSRLLRTLFMAGALAAASLVATTGSVAAYGRASQPVAQIEFSGNCDNPGYFLCAPPPDGFGTGGIWLWIEIDAGGTGDVRGAGCSHTVGGVGGPGGAGAGPIHGDVTWWPSTGPQGVAFAVDPHNLYYNVDIGDGGPPFSFPQTLGHYSFHPAPGVSIQNTIAP